MAKRYTDDQLRMFAAERGITTHVGMTHRDLLAALDMTPPVDEQLSLLERLAGRQIPVSTFGAARKKLGDIEDIVNPIALEETGWTIGTVLLVDGEYFLITRLYTSANWHRVQLTKLEAQPGEFDNAPPILSRRWRAEQRTESPHLLRQDGVTAIKATVV